MITLGIIIIGILFILIPHFALPLGYIKGGTGAMLLSECSIWYHPELYIGILTIAGALISIKYRKALFVTALAGAAGIVQAFLLRPVSFYLQSENPLIVLSQTYSIRAHSNIKITILILSVIVILLSLLPLLRRKEKQGILLSPLYVSSANLKRRRFRTIALVASLTIVIGAFFSDILLTRSIETTLEIGAGRLGADLMIVPEGERKAAEAVLLSGGPTMFYMKKDILNELRDFPEIEKASPQLYVQPFSYKVCCIVESVLIIAYDPETDFTVAPWIRYSLRNDQGPYDLVVGKLVKFYPGQKIELFGRKLNVVASLEPTGLGYFDNSVFIPLEGARKLLRELKHREEVRRIPTRQQILDKSFSHLFPTDKEKRVSIESIDPEGYSAIFVKARNNVSVKELAEKISKRFKGITVINVKESTISVKRHLSSLLRAFLLPILVLLTMGTVVLGVVFSMSVNERQREIGLLRAMGAKRHDIFQIIITESLILAGFGGIFGILFGGSLIVLFKNKIMAALDLLYIWPSPKVIFTVLTITIFISLLVGILSGFYPALRAGRLEPYYAIRAGER